MKIGPLTVHGGFFILIGLLLFFDENGMLFCLAAAAFIHEAGHFLTLKALGGRVAGLTISALGFFMRPAPSPSLSYGREIAALLAGPLFSLTAALLLPKMFPSMAYAYALAGILFVQGLFNLLPARNLDGGRALHALLTRIKGDQAADLALKRTTGITVAAIATGTAVVCCLFGFSQSFLLLGGCAVLSILTGRNRPSFKAISIGGFHERKNP